MRLVGFIKEFNNIESAVFLNDIKNSNLNKQQYQRKILKYLEKGELVFGWMGVLEDPDTGKSMGPDAYYTDGEWVWPSYFLYFLRKFPQMSLDTDFVEHLINKDFRFRLPDNYKAIKGKMESELSKKLAEQ